MDLGIEGRVAIVTGASKGIGRAIALRLAAEGVRVVVSARGQEAVEAVAAEITSGGGRAIGIPADVSNPEHVKTLVQKTIEAFGQIDILVNNAGGQRRRANFDALTDEDFLDAYSDNVLSVVRMVRESLPHMKGRQWGRIINIGSEVAKQPERTFPHYNAAKAAQWNLTKTLSKALGRDGILVNCVAPGLIETPGVRAGFEKGAADQGRTVDAVRDDFFRKFRPHSTIARPGTPDEIAGVVAFLASEHASYITGVCYEVDGGHMSTL